MGSNVILALFLWNEKCKGEFSFWAPYIDLLPSDPNLPIFFRYIELEPLQASFIFEYIAKQFLIFLKIFLVIQKIINTKSEFDVKFYPI